MNVIIMHKGNLEIKQFINVNEIDYGGGVYTIYENGRNYSFSSENYIVRIV